MRGSDWILGKDIEMDLDFDSVTHMGIKPFTEKMEVDPISRLPSIILALKHIVGETGTHVGR